MPARIVVVHDDPVFLDCVPALQAAGYDVKSFTSSMDALGALEAAQHIELLITRAAFPEGTPHGVAIARMARMKKPGIRVLFVARPENREHTEGVGEFLPLPMPASEIVAAAKRLLAEETVLARLRL